MLNRRDFLKLSGAGAAAFYASTRAKFTLRAFAQQGTPLPGSAIPQFVDPLPLLSVAGGPMETIIAGTDEIVLNMLEFQANVMPSTFVPAAGKYTGTWVWGYRAGISPFNPAGTYLGPVIVATRNQPTQIRFVNKLNADNIAWREWTDQTLHWADPLGEEMNMCNHSIVPLTPPEPPCNEHYDGSVPAVPHLHGGEVPPVLDGGPDAWFTSDGLHHGHGYYTKAGAAANECIYRYPNTMEAAPIWFHDHLLGGTRLNVYAGLAGAYPIIDPDLDLPTGLHPVGLQQGSSGPVDFLVPMVLQDRMFDTNGQLFFPNTGINPEHPYWIPEFTGDTIVVNGKVWPFLNVGPRRYRFLFVNGSNARTYEMFIANPVTKVMGPPLWQIGTDGGYLDAPVKIDPNARALQRLVLMPGERADVIIDFSGFAGQTLILRNIAKTPYPGGDTPMGSTLGRVIQFRVGPGPVSDASYDPASGIPLRPPMVRLVNPATGTLAAGVTAQVKRQMTLNEIANEEEPIVVGGITYEGGPVEILVNNTKWSGESDRPYGDFTPIIINGITTNYSELPNEGDTEVWEIINLTADAHPIHTHLTQFQLIGRQKFDVPKYNAVYEAAFPSGAFEPGFGPPLDYNSTNTDGAIGGNPAVGSFLKGPKKSPSPNEAGWKDTVQMLPGEVTRIAVRYAPMNKSINDPNLYYPFDPNAEGHGYVWHCHIVDHEDNEMMRPYKVNAKNVTRTYVQGIDY